MVERLNHAEIDTILSDAGTGVLSLTNGTETYALPQSVGYDGEYLYFQFVAADDSKKMKFVDTTEIATVTVFTETPSQSVIARGHLEEVPPHKHPHATKAVAENATMPTFDIHPEKPLRELSMEFYQLEPIEITGQRFGSIE